MTLLSGVKLYGKTSGRKIVVCSKCGEVNSDNFRFCGMCGTLLDTKLDTKLETKPEIRRPVTALSGVASGVSAGASRTTNPTEPLHPVVTENLPKAANQVVPPIGGPSVLGLNQ